MELTALSFSALLGYLQQAIAGIVDPRRPSNGTRYSLQDVVLGAFACFFMQSESFLEHQRQLNSRCGRDNAQTLFGLERIPTVEQMSNLLDDRFNNRTLAQQDLVEERHEGIFHVLTAFSNQLQATHKERFKECLRNVPPITKQLSH